MRIIEREQGFLICKGIFPFTKYWCHSWGMWVKKNHFLYKKCFLNEKDAYKYFNLLTMEF